MKNNAQKTELIRTSQSWDGAELLDHLPADVRAASEMER